MAELIEVVNKTPIEIALQIDDEGFTTAKKLYKWLELDVKNYSHWCKRNILENEFAEENVDFVPFVLKNERNPKPTTDYKLSAKFAKKLSMMAKSVKGEQARVYFIGCEQALVRLAEQKHKTEIERQKGIVVRQALTKAIQQSNENERMHGHAYSVYTDLVYKVIYGKTAKQLREEHNITKSDKLRDVFTPEELEKVQAVEMIVSGLVNCGWGYNDIKEFVTNKKLIADTEEL